MRASVVIRSKDEADRLRLTLASLSRQTARCEVVVVDDGSSDHTAEVLVDASAGLDLTIVRNAAARGRSEASNLGAARARGDVLIFLDGDTLASPELVERHLDAHAGGLVVGRGETFHLRKTRFFRDPEQGTPQLGQEERIARMRAAELDRARVTRTQVLDDFARVAEDAEPGIYPGFGPRRLYEMEMDALRRHPDCPVLWAAACGSNQSVRKEAFLASGGFDATIDINEHRELALRLCAAGARMVPVEGARTYHMTHRTGWRDPLADTRWEDVFYARHPLPAVKLLPIFWASVSGAAALGEDAIPSLPALAKVGAAGLTARHEAARAAIRARARGGAEARP